MKRLLAFIVVTIVAVSIGIAAAASYMDLGKQLAVSEEEQKKELVSKLAPVLMDELRNRIKVGLRIYKNGELVYYNPNDPISYEWMKLIVNYLFGCIGMGCAYTITATDGMTLLGLETMYGTPYNPQPAIAIGNGTTPASPEDYRLERQIAVYKLYSEDVVVNDTGTSYDIYFRHVFTFQESINVSEAGLLLYARVLGSDTKYYWKYILIARDTFSPITVSAGEAIAVEYVVSVDYSSPPFTREFWKVLVDYFLGLGGIGLGLGVSLDFGVDETDTYDLIRESIYVAYILEPITWSPDITNENVTNISAMWRPRMWVPELTPTSIIMKGFVIQGHVGPVYTVYGIAIYLCTDTDPSGGVNKDYVLIAVIPFDQPVTVDWSTGFSIELGLSFA